MSIIKKDKAEMKEEEEIDEKKDVYRVFPDIDRAISHDEGVVDIQIALPGVKKQNITLKALPTWFHLNAHRGQIEYSANQDWGVEVVPEKTKAKYDNGLLQIKGYIKDPFEGATEVKL